MFLGHDSRGYLIEFILSFLVCILLLILQFCGVISVYGFFICGFYFVVDAVVSWFKFLNSL